MDELKKTLGGLGVGIFGYGVLTNILTLTLCLKQTMRKMPTFVFIAFMAVNDSFTLFFLVSLSFYQTFYNEAYTHASYFLCRVTTFFQGMFLFSSAWLLVSMNVERCLAVAVRQWKNVNFDSKKAVIVSVLVILVSFSISIHLVFETKYVELPVGNSTFVTRRCVQTDYVYVSWSRYSPFGYTIAPFIVIAISNCILAYFILRGSSKAIKRTDEAKTKRRSISVSVIVLTLSFIVLTAPAAISQGFLKELAATQTGLILMRVLNVLFFIYYGSGFTFLMIVNRQFSREFKNAFSFLIPNGCMSNDVHLTKTKTVKSNDKKNHN